MKLKHLTLIILTAHSMVSHASQGMSSGIDSLQSGISTQHVRLTGIELSNAINALMNKVIDRIKTLSEFPDKKNKQLMQLWKNRIELSAFGPYDAKPDLENKDIESLVVNKILPLYNTKYDVTTAEKYGFKVNEKPVLTRSDEYILDNHKEEFLKKLTKRLYEIWDIKI